MWLITGHVILFVVLLHLSKWNTWKSPLSALGEWRIICVCGYYDTMPTLSSMFSPFKTTSIKIQETLTWEKACVTFFLQHWVSALYTQPIFWPTLYLLTFHSGLATALQACLFLTSHVDNCLILSYPPSCFSALFPSLMTGLNMHSPPLGNLCKSMCCDSLFSIGHWGPLYNLIGFYSGSASLRWSGLLLKVWQT